ncbi:MAG TPA: hypothetical protein VNT52_04330 [Acidimicrobiales bacterium]|nr:hypothetical protein [Acidimicrobiales bacterium]
MLKAQILLASLVLVCGQVIVWRRRDNILGYLQGGLFFASMVVPILGTTIIDNSDPEVLGLYARILLIGAVGYLGGLLYGALIGQRQRLPSVTFGRPFAGVPSVIARRSRLIAIGALAALGLSFLLLGYIPFLAADRVGAKYGIGVYRAGLERGALVFHVALRLGSTILPVVLALWMRRRRGLDLFLAAGLGLGLLLTLSRGSALLGPLVFVVALLVSRSWKAWQILALVCACYLSATLVNEVVQVTRPTTSASFSTRVAASAPDLSDHLGFINGFEVSGAQHVGFRPLLAGLSLNKGDFNPSTYALRIRTGLLDRGEFAAGGLRLPAPIWGYAAFGYLGAMAWSFVSGLFVGWGSVVVRRLVTPLHGHSGQALNLVLAWVSFQGTFAILGHFYFPQRVEIVSLGLAVALCWTASMRWNAAKDDTPDAPERTVASTPA